MLAMQCPVGLFVSTAAKDRVHHRDAKNTVQLYSGCLAFGAL